MVHLTGGRHLTSCTLNCFAARLVDIRLCQRTHLQLSNHWQRLHAEDGFRIATLDELEVSLGKGSWFTMFLQWLSILSGAEQPGDTIADGGECTCVQ